MRKSIVSMMFGLLTAVVFGLSGCGGGGGGSSTPTVSGVAATGAPLANASITLVDSKGAVKPSTTDSNGNYTITVTDMTPPFVIKADAGGGKFLYSYSATTGTVNVNPFSDLIVRSAATGGTPETSISTILSNLSTAKNQLNNTFAAMLTAYSVPGAYDPITSSYAIGNALDRLLDDISVSVASGAVTITNKSNNSTIYSATVTSQGAFGGVFTAGNIPTPSNTGGTTPTGNAKLAGLYGGAFFREANPSQSVSGYYSITADGSGNVSSSGKYSMTDYQTNVTENSTETYSVKPDGSFIISYDSNPFLLNQTNDMIIKAEVMSPGYEGQTISVYAKKGTSSYSNASLNGKYYFVKFDHVHISSPSTKYAYFGSILFNGSGGYTMSGNYTKLGALANQAFNDSGTYSVSADGSVILTDTDPSTFKGHINSTNDVVLLANADELKEQGVIYMVKAGSSTFTNASLNGDYYVVNLAHELSLIESCYGTMNFNGTGIYSFGGKCGSNGGATNSPRSFGPFIYTMNSNGTFIVNDSSGNSLNGALDSSSKFFIASRINDINNTSIFFGMRK